MTLKVQLYQEYKLNLIEEPAPAITVNKPKAVCIWINERPTDIEEETLCQVFFNEGCGCVAKFCEQDTL